MKKNIDVKTGDMQCGDSKTVLSATGIGSCVVLCVYGFPQKIGFMAHVLLPGRSAVFVVGQKAKYACNAVGLILGQMSERGLSCHDVEACLVGGANVLQRDVDLIGERNVDSVLECLKENNIRVRAKAVGGIQRRVVRFDVEMGSVFYSEGDGEERFLWASEESGMKVWRDQADEYKGLYRKALEENKTKDREIRKLKKNNAHRRPIIFFDRKET